MNNEEFLHKDPDSFHDHELTLHDCVADKIMLENGVLCFNFPNGFWITPNHNENQLNKTVRTDSSAVEFTIENIDDITIRIFKRNRFLGSQKITVEDWKIEKLISDVNNGKRVIEFITQYRSFYEQMWECVIRLDKKPYHIECQLYLPNTKATYYWNNLRADREW